jgi:hypothetical protein
MNHTFDSFVRHKNLIIMVVGVAAIASYMIPFEQILSTADAAKPAKPPGKPAPTCKPPGKYCNQITPKPKLPNLLLGAELFGLNLS